MKIKIFKFIIGLVMVISFISITNYMDLHYESLYTDICRIIVEVIVYLKIIYFVDVLFKEKEKNK